MATKGRRAEHRAIGGDTESASERATQYIKRLILTGELPMGSILNEERLSEEIGLSRTPVREALQILQTQGLVRIERYRGASVTGLDTNDVRDVYDLRVCLEHHAITQALRTGAELDLDELRSIVTTHEAEVETAKPENVLHLIDLDRAFHFGIIRLHPNARLEQILGTTWDQVVRGSFKIMQRQPVQAASVKEHRVLLTALENRALPEALQASEEHLHNAIRRLLLST